MCIGPFPNNFISKMFIFRLVFLIPDGIHNPLEIMTRGWITMQIDGASLFEDAMELHEPGSHESEISAR